MTVRDAREVVQGGHLSGKVFSQRARRKSAQVYRASPADLVEECPEPANHENRRVNQVADVTHERIGERKGCAVGFDDADTQRHLARSLAVIAGEEQPLIAHAHREAHHAAQNPLIVCAKRAADDAR